MAQLNIRGQVLHAPGPWGNARPAGGVSLAIVDEDVGNAADTIWTGSTNAQGQYAGTTRDWRDMRTVTVATPGGPRSTQVADAADLMLLKATASQRVGSRLHSLTVPFVPAPAGLPQPPIVLGWGPAGHARVSVGGVTAHTLSQLAGLIEGAFSDGAAATAQGAQRVITVYDETLEAMIGLMVELEPELRAIEAQFLQLDRQGILRLKAQRQQAVSQAQAQGARAAAVGRGLNPGPPAGPDPLGPVRQRLLALPPLLAQRLRQRLGPRDLATGGQAGVLCDAVLRQLGPTVAAAINVAIGIGSLTVGVATTGVTLMVAVVTALVRCVVAVVQSLPALLMAVSMLTGSSVLADASAQASEFLEQSWVAATLAVILCLCMIVMVAATAPAAGWSWFVEQVTGENGLPGLRLVLTR